MKRQGGVRLKGTTIFDRLPLDNVVRPSGLRRRNAPYLAAWILYYAWVVAFATWWTASPVPNAVFDTPIRSLMHTVNLLSSAVFVFVIRREWSVRASKIGAALIVVSMAFFYALPSASLKMAAAAVGAAAIGCVNICILIPFVFTLNNTEKLYAVVWSNVLIQAVSLINEHGASGLVEPVLSFALLICSLGAVLFGIRGAASGLDTQAVAGKPGINRRIYLSLLFNCAIAVLCKGTGRGVLNIAIDGAGPVVLTEYYVGGLAGCLIYLLVYAFTKKAYIWLGNITFSCVAVGFLCNAFIPQAPRLTAPFAVLLGAGSAVGMINMYYIIGVIGKKYDSMRYVRLSILLIGVCGGVAGVTVGNAVSRIGTFEVSVSASVLSAAVMIAFMFVSPVMERADYANDWGLDSGNTEVSDGRISCFRAYGLSRRESEVCDLLLQGYTLRQISAILPIAYSTVNTYCTSAYRKLGINSRTELFLKFRDLIVK